VQEIIVGIIIVAAVAADGIRRRVTLHEET
jgi:hypothetical protein